MSAHAQFAPSSAFRYFMCPGAYKLEQAAPKAPSSVYADEGTRAHAYMAYLLDPLHQPIGEPDDDDMVLYIRTCIDYVDALKLDSMKVEVRVKLDDWVPDCYGTVDVLGRQGTRLHVIDLKYGRGTAISAIDNEQLQTYSLGAWSAYLDWFDITDITMHILQPRLDRMLKHSVTVPELKLFGNRLTQVWDECISDDAPLVPGDHQCQFCKAVATCPAISNMNMQMAQMEFGALERTSTLPVVESLDIEQLSYIYRHKSLISTWISEIEQYLTREIQHGRPVPGYKLVEGRTLRKWKNPDDAEQALRKVTKLKVKDILKTSLISPAQAEKLIGKHHEILTKHVTKPEGKPTIVLDEDSRRELRPAIEHEFEELTQ